MTWDIPTSHRIIDHISPLRHALRVAPTAPYSLMWLQVKSLGLLPARPNMMVWYLTVLDVNVRLVLSSYPERSVSSTISDWNKSIRYLGCFGFLFDSVFLLRKFRKDRHWIRWQPQLKTIKYLQFRALSDQSPLSKSDLVVGHPSNWDTTSNITLKNSSLPTEMWNSCRGELLKSIHIICYMRTNPNFCRKKHLPKTNDTTVATFATLFDNCHHLSVRQLEIDAG